MPGGKRKLKQLFTSGMQVGNSGNETFVTEIIAGSVGFATAGCADTAVSGACSVAEVTITGLSPCSMMIGNAEDMSACFTYSAVIAGDGQASVVYRYAGCGASVDARASGGVLRFIAFGV